MTELFDTHCHLTEERLTPQLPAVIRRMREAGVTRCVTIGVSEESSRAAVRLAEAEAGVYASIGVHCEYTEGFGEADLVWLAELAQHEKVVAIGEIGLDYYWKEPSPEVQKRAFIAQLELAARLNLSAVLHVREAHADALAILRENQTNIPKLILHCFGGNADDARAYLALGAYISFAGNVTYKKAYALREAAAIVPLDRLLVETDAPYLAPEPLRGRLNEPANVRHTASYLAKLKGIDEDEFANTTTRNALRAFGLLDR